ncbi:hypothetical protein RRF57_000901 [Xylaria bambusicola]|uniref:Uncharacterized protein n=1 Tax=Xylaria bambusicola TaxID=326684 RepID=A0AAN7U476_9PEZI
MGNCLSAPSQPQQQSLGDGNNNVRVLPGPRLAPQSALSRGNTGNLARPQTGRCSAPRQHASVGKKVTIVDQIQNAPREKQATIVDQSSFQIPRDSCPSQGFPPQGGDSSAAKRVDTWQTAPWAEGAVPDGIFLIDANEVEAATRMAKPSNRWGNIAAGIANRNPTFHQTKPLDTELDPAYPLPGEKDHRNYK